jgi:hypothetical protein
MPTKNDSLGGRIKQDNQAKYLSAGSNYCLKTRFESWRLVICLKHSLYSHTDLSLNPGLDSYSGALILNSMILKQS